MPRQKGLLRACSYVYQSLAAVASATLIAGNDLCLGVEPADFHPWGDLDLAAGHARDFGLFSSGAGR